MFVSPALCITCFLPRSNLVLSWTVFFSFKR